MGAADSRSLRFDSYVRMQQFVRHGYKNYSFVVLPLFLFGVFYWMCGENSCNGSLFFMVLWVPIFAALCWRAVLMLWHAFLFLGLRSVGFFSLLAGLLLLAWWLSLLFLVKVPITKEENQTSPLCRKARNHRRSAPVITVFSL
jgi:hypothetical protein